MTASQQARLTENIKRDGGLTSAPLVWLMQDQGGTPTKSPPEYEVLSGNHRVASAREAGILEIDCIVILNWLSPERRVEIQLAHNAVEGQDDLAILQGLYESLSLMGKEYSGLTDDVFSALGKVDLSGLSVSAPAYQEIVVSFLPADAEQFLAFLKRCERSKKALKLAARLEAFDKLFDAIVTVKDRENIYNSAIALEMVGELAMQRLEQLEAAGQDIPQEDATQVIEAAE